ncbi:hypothetical protein WJX77_011688 [Trebouxia sp. C0004]
MFNCHLPVFGNSSHLLPRHSYRPSRLAAVRAWKAPFGLGKKPAKKQSQEVQKDLEEFQEWAVKHGLPKQQVEVQTIPDALLLTADKAAQECCIGSALKDAGMFDWTVLATYLVELRDQQEQSPASSYWAEYVALLPNNTGCILEWTAKEVHNLLAGSPLQKKAMDIQDAAEKSWHEVQPVLQQAAVQGLIKPEAYTQRRYQWAFSILLTRMCRLPGRCNEEVLVAWGDMANHRSDVTSFWDWDRTKKQIVFQPDCSYDPESNPNDAYLLEIALDEDDSQLQGKLAALQQYGLSARQQFPLKVNALPDGLLEYAAFIAATPGRSDEIPILAEYLFGKHQFPLLDKVDCRILGVNYVLTVCRTAMLGYKKTMEVDKEYIETQRKRLQDSTFDTEDSSGSQVAQIERSIAAAVLRVRERQILHRTTFILKQSKR